MVMNSHIFTVTITSPSQLPLHLCCLKAGPLHMSSSKNNCSSCNFMANLYVQNLMLPGISPNWFHTYLQQTARVHSADIGMFTIMSPVLDIAAFCLTKWPASDIHSSAEVQLAATSNSQLMPPNSLYTKTPICKIGYIDMLCLGSRHLTKHRSQVRVVTSLMYRAANWHPTNLRFCARAARVVSSSDTFHCTVSTCVIAPEHCKRYPSCTEDACLAVVAFRGLTGRRRPVWAKMPQVGSCDTSALRHQSSPRQCCCHSLPPAIRLRSHFLRRQQQSQQVYAAGVLHNACL